MEHQPCLRQRLCSLTHLHGNEKGRSKALAEEEEERRRSEGARERFRKREPSGKGEEEGEMGKIFFREEHRRQVSRERVCAPFT